MSQWGLPVKYADVYVYVTNDFDEEPLVIRRVVSVIVIDGMLTIESEKSIRGGGISTNLNRFAHREWERFEVNSHGTIV